MASGPDGGEAGATEVALSAAALDVGAAYARLLRGGGGGCGGVALFVGTTRADASPGGRRRVASLEYEAYAPPAMHALHAVAKAMHAVLRDGDGAGDGTLATAGGGVLATAGDGTLATAGGALATTAGGPRATTASCCVVVLHRVGAVAVGEASVVVGAAAPHRAAALAAVARGIDLLKAVAPIWKREVYDDGTPGGWPANAEARREPA
jgi:molybdopterin synthase catalytic subunit